MKSPHKKLPRKPVFTASWPGKVIAQWGDGPLLTFERQRLAPLTAEEFLKACKTYFPAELQTPAAAFLLDMAQRADADKKDAGRGRPPGIGSQVEELMTGSLRWDQKTARRLVAGGLCDCRDKDGFPAEQCACGSYERVAALHKQFRLDQRKAEQKDE